MFRVHAVERKGRKEFSMNFHRMTKHFSVKNCRRVLTFFVGKRREDVFVPNHPIYILTVGKNNQTQTHTQITASCDFSQKSYFGRFFKGRENRKICY